MFPMLHSVLKCMLRHVSILNLFQARVVAHKGAEMALGIYKDAKSRPGKTTSVFLQKKGLLLNGTFGGAHSNKATFITAFKGICFLCPSLCYTHIHSHTPKVVKTVPF